VTRKKTLRGDWTQDMIILVWAVAP